MDKRKRRDSPKVRARVAVKKREILDEAAKLFSTTGYASTSLEAIALACGMGKATLYHYFSTREDILVNMHEILAEHLKNEADKAASQNLSAREELTAAMVAMVSANEKMPGYVRLFFDHYRELEAGTRKRLFAMRQNYHDYIENLIIRGQSNGEFKKCDSQLATMAVFGMCNWTFYWFGTHNGNTGEEVGNFMAQTVLSGLSSET